MAKASLIELRPMDYVYTCKSMTGCSMLSWLKRFLCSVELVERFPLANVRSLVRPLLDHTPLDWARNEGQRGSTSFKLERSWLGEVETAWRAQNRHAFVIETVATRIEGLRKHFTRFRKHTWEVRNKRRSKALSRLKS